MSVFTYAHGKTGTVQINSVTYRVNQWDSTGETSFDDVTDTGSLGFGQQIAGLRKATGSLQLYFDTTTPPTINDGDTLTNAVFGNTPVSTLVPMFSCASIQVTSKAITSQVAGTVTLTLNWMSNSAYQWGALPS